MQVTGETYDTVDATLPSVDSQKFPLLAGIDRYEDTVFSGPQMSMLVNELRGLLINAPPRRRTLLEDLIGMCEMGSKTPHAQLWILGD